MVISSRPEEPTGVVDKLDEAVYLLVFVVLVAENLVVGGEHAEIDERGDALALREKIFLFTVVRGGGRGGRGGLAGELVAAVAAENVLPALAAGDYKHLPVAAFKLAAAERGKLFSAEVLVHGLVVAYALGLIYRLAADGERADAELLRGGLVRRLAEYGLAELRQRRGKNIADVRHCYLLIMMRNCELICDSRIDKPCPNGTAQRPSLRSNLWYAVSFP